MVKLFIVGFPKEMGDIELDQLFSNEALVRKVTIIRDMQTGVSKGYAFVEILDKLGAQRAIKAFNGLTIGDRTISVRIAEIKTSNSNSPGFHSSKCSSRPDGMNGRFKRPRNPRHL